jgi:glycosyltransferase involved in cell wall biosynthesis
MRIVLDARWIGATPSGIGVYAVELLRRLPALEPDWQFHLLFDDDALRERVLDQCGLADIERVSAETLPYGLFSIEGQIRLPRRLRQLRADLFHSPNYMIPYRAFPEGTAGRGAMRCVTTIHDVIPLLLRDHAPQSRKSRMLPLFRHCLRQSVRRSDAVLTVSETSRRDIIRVLNLGEAEAAKLLAVYNGVDARFTPLPAGAPRGRVRTILYVGRLDPYKHVVTLVRAFNELRRQMREPLHLLIVGPDDPRYPEARRVTADLGLAECVTFLGFIENDELAAAYQEAALLVNPSSYEGFGLQLVEAMRCGVPVVCSDGGAQPEIAGQAARLVPVGDTQALADAMREVLCDEALRARLIAAGLARAREFNWLRTARQTQDLYRRVLGLGEVPA